MIALNYIVYIGDSLFEGKSGVRNMTDERMRNAVVTVNELAQVGDIARGKEDPVD